jgi:UDP-N-acetylglucosamine/UDP-N-acetylgalactosamine 4-epimerase
MSSYPGVLQRLEESPRSWLVTGAAGFIGSHLVETLLRHGQRVVGVDNFATGSRRNLTEAVESSGAAGDRFRFIEGDLVDPEVCRESVRGVDVILHQAALGSVPRSVADPLSSHHANLTAFLNLLLATREAGIRRMVYASSSAVYGDEPNLPKREERIGLPLSPYAVTKRADELYAHVAQELYGLELVGLRYFNVFGPRQDPAGPYAAVIPRWVESLLTGDRCTMFGDGETSRDFCYVANAVQANLLSAAASLPEGGGARVYNVACGERTTLNALFRGLRERVARHRPEAGAMEPEHLDFRPGDVRHSEADIAAIRRDLGYEPSHYFLDGLDLTVDWYAAAARGGARAGSPAS